ncbi:hypothetical protein SAMN05428976_11622 [Clostridium sp. USBA 49]|uniref:hypothetical protein n=1 Tax=Clostridium sp. USBA 49 TaxID=1881060 RepID=UPI00099ACFE3|nr:hypothetical protein [Clostridium sp. USBA 49]SKA91171.1 hypothetical protein SAMN05428976_11622 [Clostridium sp. USBA 49]
MNLLLTIFIYMFIIFIEVIPLYKNKAKKKALVYIIVMLLPLILSVNIASGSEMQSIASITTKLFKPILKQFQEM